MSEKPKRDDLKQTTPKGYEIPVPAHDEFFGALDKAAKKNSGREKPSRSGPEKP